MTRLVVDALAARYGGTAYAAVAVAKELAADLDVVVVARQGSLVAEGLKGVDAVSVHVLPAADQFELQRRVAWQAVGLPTLMRDGNVLLTWSGMLPVHGRGRIAAYLANPVMLRDPGPANAVRRAAARRTARQAAAVLVPTKEMAGLVRGALASDARVVPLGLDHDRFKPGGEDGTELLCVADMYRHKRHDVVLEAWAALEPPRPALRLIGDSRVEPRNAERVTRRARELGDLGEIHVQQEIPLSQLVAAYHRARAFVLPSERESFCLPVLEALACGVPAVVRDEPTLRETADGGALFVSGDDPAEWAAAVHSVLDDDRIRRELRERGLQHASSYSWVRTATEIRDALGL